MLGASAVGTSVFSLLPIAYGELLGRENIQSAMAVNFVYQGLGSITSTFTIGTCKYKRLLSEVNT